MIEITVRSIALSEGQILVQRDVRDPNSPYAFIGGHVKLGDTLAGRLKLEYEEEQALCRSQRSLGHGVDESITDVIYVRRQGWEAAANKQIAQEIGLMNKRLETENRRYLLIGPGRWGTADAWLGIPVQWSQISMVRAMIEASPKGYDVEPSQGTHFFQNISSLRVGYLTLPPGAERSSSENGDFLDWD